MFEVMSNSSTVVSSLLHSRVSRIRFLEVNLLKEMLRARERTGVWDDFKMRDLERMMRWNVKTINERKHLKSSPQLAPVDFFKKSGT